MKPFVQRAASTLWLLLGMATLQHAHGHGQFEPLTPVADRRAEGQSFLTFPEWFLVYSPAEYASLLRERLPSAFPWRGHIGQFWSSYRAVIGATGDEPFNAEYHVTICVIGISTTVEYTLRLVYETLLGRLTELNAPSNGTAEDRYAAKVAQDYVDFIRVRPWYEFNFVSALHGLWRDSPATGPGMLRKWERRYALSTEYAIKAVYGWLLGLGTASAYGVASPVTTVVLDTEPRVSVTQGHEPVGVEGQTTAGQRQAGQAQAGQTQATPAQPQGVLPDGRWLGRLPRYEAFKDAALELARAGHEFHEIAGNGPQARLLVSVVAPQAWLPAPAIKVLFEQPILTQPGRRRLALQIHVADLAPTLRMLDAHAAGVELEHVYDY